MDWLQLVAVCRFIGHDFKYHSSATIIRETLKDGSIESCTTIFKCTRCGEIDSKRTVNRYNSPEDKQSL